MRVLMYVPYLPAHLADSVAATASILSTAARRDGWAVQLLGRGLDGFTQLPERPPGKRAAFVQGHPEDFAILAAEAVRADVVFCPYPFGVLPPDLRALVPAPVVFGVGPLFFDEADLGAATDKYRTEIKRVIDSAAALVFANEQDRESAQRYGLPADRCHVLDAQGLPWLFSHVPARPACRLPAGRSKEQRIAWLLTHTTLREAEAKLLRELGYEVWTAKKVDHDPNFRSGDGDTAWDAGLSLPTDVLAALNAHNFYTDPLTPEVAAAINGYFGTLITDPFPEKVVQLLKHFQGRILVRAFGREHPRTYTELLDSTYSPHLSALARTYRDRFWFAPCYDAIVPVEGEFLQSRSVMLPLALPDRVLRAADTWVGGDKRVFFVCPSIRTSPGYYGVIYDSFKQEYGDFPHLIGGQQGIKVDDPFVTGFVTDDEMRRQFREMQVMYYHSREPRHIHYHPLEAIVHGMPVVYMRGGLMEAFDTGSQAGACDTDDEARAKLRRILDGDAALIREIQESQRTILEGFLPHNVRDVWEKRFVGRIMGGPVAEVPPAGAPPALPPDRFVAPPSPLPNDLGEFPAPSAMRIKAIKVGSTIATDAQARPGLEKPARGVFGKAARACYMGWKVLSLYASAAWRQRTPLPRGTGAWHYLPGVLRSWWPRPKAQYDWAADEGLDELVPLRPVPVRPDELPSTPTCVLDPIGWLDPRLAHVPSLPLTVAYSRLPGEEDDSFGKFTPSVMAEAKLWMRMAQQVVFCCEEDRAAAIRRYGVEPGKTTVLPGERLYGPVPQPVAVPGLPARYLLACGGPQRRENVPLVARALEMLRQRGFDVPEVVWSALPSLHPERHVAHQARSVTLAEPQLAAATRGAERVIVNVRSGAEAARRVYLAALAKIPVIAVDSAAVRAAQWTEDEIVLVPADDPVALADALSSPVDAERVGRAYRHAVSACGMRRAA